MTEDPFQITSNPDYSKYIHLSRYSRWMEHKGRRESWEETVDRLIEFWCKEIDNNENIPETCVSMIASGKQWKAITYDLREGK